MLPCLINSVSGRRHYKSHINHISLAFANNNRHHSNSQQHQHTTSYTNVHRRCFHRTGPLHLNRILFDISEIDDASLLVSNDDDEDIPPSSLATVTFSKDDYRTIHVAKILGLQNGDTLRSGSVRSPSIDNDDDIHKQQLAGLITDEATITWIPEGKIKKAQPTKNGDPPGSLQISIPHPPLTSLWHERSSTDMQQQQSTDSSSTTAEDNDIPQVSLLLAVPRPLQLARILPMIAQLGVDQLILTNAKKVPKDYFGSHIFRKPEVLRGMLVEGLSLSGDVMLPNVTVTKRLKIFMEDRLDHLFPRHEYARVIAHPTRKDDGEGDELRMSDIIFPTSDDRPKRILVAVG